MLDLTIHGDSELSMHVFNDEYFYSIRGDEAYLLALVKEEFIYTQDQLDELMQDLEDDREEEEG